MMKKTMMFVAVLAVLFCVLPRGPLATGKQLAKDDALPIIKLPVPQTPGAKSYLGLTGEGSFAVSQIKAQVVIIEIFNMYCSNCQREAPKVNELFRAVNKDQKLKEKIKLIGIGAGNTPFEAEVFRKNYRVLFPLFPDEDYAIHKAIGEVRTPFFICAKRNADGTLNVFHINKGGFQDAAQFLKQIVTVSGL
jgi:peroxiredoxin